MSGASLLSPPLLNAVPKDQAGAQRTDVISKKGLGWAKASLYSLILDPLVDRLAIARDCFCKVVAGKSASGLGDSAPSGMVEGWARRRF